MPRFLDPSSLAQHLDRLYNAALGLTGSPHAAEDLVQETCARVLAKPRRLRRSDDLGYLMGVLRNTFRDELRSRGHRPATEPLDEDLLATEERRALQPEAALESQQLHEAIASLAEPFRDACIAVDVIGLSYRDAARALSVPEGTLTSRLFRARHELALRLGDEGDATRRPPDRRRSRPQG